MEGSSERLQPPKERLTHEECDGFKGLVKKLSSETQAHRPGIHNNTYKFGQTTVTIFLIDEVVHIPNPDMHRYIVEIETKINPPEKDRVISDVLSLSIGTADDPDHIKFSKKNNVYTTTNFRLAPNVKVQAPAIEMLEQEDSVDIEPDPETISPDDFHTVMATLRTLKKEDLVKNY